MNADVLRRWWPRVQALAGAAVLVVLAARVGAGPLLDGLRAVDAPAVLAALAVGFVTTVLSAARWSLVARGLGVPLPLRAAVADTYRAQFLNAVLPAGVLGDVDRAVSHGLRDGGRAARAVVLERVAGQTVVVLAGAIALGVSASGLLDSALLAPGLLAALTLTATAAALTTPLRRRTPPQIRHFGARTLFRRPLDSVVAPKCGASREGRAWVRWVRGGVRDVGAGLAGRVGVAVVLLSVAGLAGHLALFVVAARAAGVQAPLGVLLPLLLAALLAMVLPVNVGGWGPREAVAAVGFGAAGLGAGLGVTVAVVFGVLGLVSCLPGAGVLLLRRTRSARAAAAVPSRVAEVVGC